MGKLMREGFDLSWILNLTHCLIGNDFFIADIATMLLILRTVDDVRAALLL